MKKTSIIIPVYKNINWTKICIDSILANTNQYELIIINNSDDKNINDLISNYNFPIKSHSFDKNVGSYHAWNYAVNNLISDDSDYLCFMHNDTLVSEDWLSYLVNHLEYNKDIGITSPCTNYVDENEYLFSRELMDLYLQYKPNNKDNISIEDLEELICNTYMIDSIYDFNLFTDRIRRGSLGRGFNLTSNISTFCCLMNKNVFDTYGPFDDEFYPHLYSEKLMKKKMSIDGLKSSCCCDVFVHHNGNTTTDGIQFVYQEIARKNKLIYETKLEELEKEVLKI